MSYRDNDDTIFAPATIPGTGAITVVRVSGSAAIDITDRIVTFRPHSSGKAEATEAGEVQSAWLGKSEATGLGKAETTKLEKVNTSDAETVLTTEAGEVQSAGLGKAETPDAESVETTEAGAKSEYGIKAAKGYTIHFGTVELPGGGLLDEVLVSVFRAPHSYTGEDSVEISCHASPYIIDELSSILIAAGARPAEPGEFTMRSFLNGKMDLAQAEAVADVIASQSAASHRIAINQLKGGYSCELQSMRDELLQIAALMELELDFSEEDVEFADRSRLDGLLNAAISHVEGLADSFRLGNAVKYGVPTAIIGATNTGKSTLLNKLLGEERAIVSPIRGTTRDTVEEPLDIEGVLFRLIDTAGLRDTSEAIEKIGIERSLQKAAVAEIVLGMVDGTVPGQERSAQIEAILSLTDPSRQDIHILLNKSDLLTPPRKTTLSHPTEEGSELNPAENHTPRLGENNEAHTVEISESPIGGIYEQFAEIKKVGPQKNDGKGRTIKYHFISAKTGEGVPALLHDLASTQKERISNAGAVAVTNYRHLEALRSAASALNRVRSGLHTNLPTDLLVQDLREALSAIGSITGQVQPEEVLTSIFSHFCIGK